MLKYFIVISVIIMFIFPVFCNINVFVNVKQKRAYYGIFVFKIIKIYGGYCEPLKDGIIFHLSNKNATILPYKSFIDSSKKFVVTKGIEIIRFHSVVEYGDDDISKSLLFSVSYQLLSDLYFSVINTNKPFISLKNSVLYCDKQNTNKLSVNIVTVFNLLILSVAFVKIIMEKIYEKIQLYKQRKQQD